jgi:cytochrome c oxidase subunit 4
MKQNSPSVKTYTYTFISLMVLALATSLIGMVDLGPLSMPTAVIIASMKAILIAAFFMNALYSSKVIRVMLSAGVIWVLIMITLTLGDYMTRGWVDPLAGK